MSDAEVKSAAHEAWGFLEQHAERVRHLEEELTRTAISAQRTYCQMVAYKKIAGLLTKQLSEADPESPLVQPSGEVHPNGKPKLQIERLFQTELQSLLEQAGIEEPEAQEG